ncbi:hypothetical protein ERO13_D05G284500v2 [Gossypium hirsutum]|uniref:Protein LNK3 isoform X4 n=3 Tax=Gossypium TaxID=3633 RepID=A0ABM3A6S2_GOSHI|nr:protein LNK3 isoform X4 [Gossypium raimondii]XP_040950552.1 protein LNK3 isoform X4 [Gossypium hirsutum]KAG4148422.1 hypothetical protein ERO13_D05G284500v2 [Gossypium hirsutum]KJB60300.1 hypothetical protein B456_009G299100 [Gossypium raimondii]TYH73250.1 hypothetical protein ES332_D05G315700v1 [Gossypium tomentosum]
MTYSCTKLNSWNYLSCLWENHIVMNNSMLGHPMIIEGFGRGSLLEDPTWSEDLQKSFCFSPEYECETMATDHLLEDITANGLVSKGISLEESVLKELETVTAQLSDKTRICFRDAFYRLAKNSKQNPVALNQQGNLHVRTHSPKWTISEEKIRSGKKETTESETNTIDRTIANLTFDKMDMNVRDFPVCHTRQL